MAKTKAPAKAKSKPKAKMPTTVKKRVGAPSKYKEEYNKQAYRLCLLGSTDAQLADFFEVNEDTINEWKKVYPEFSESIKEGKVVADAVIAEGLYNRAAGMVITKEVAIKLTTKEPALDAAGEPTRIMKQTERIEIVSIREEVPPETTAGIIWLKNRNPKNWKDKQVIEATGPDGEAIKHSHKFTIDILSTAAGISQTEKEIQEAVNNELGITDEN